MRALRLDRLVEFLSSMGLLVGLLWLGLAVLTVALLILMQTRWGQSRPLRKCVVLSLLAHLLLAGYATTVQIVASCPRLDEPVMDVCLVENRPQQPAATADTVPEEKPWEQLPYEAVSQPEQIDLERPLPDEPPEPHRPSRSEPADLERGASLEHLTLAEAEQPEPQPPQTSGATGRVSPVEAAAQIEVPAAQRRQPDPPNLPAAAAPGRPAIPGETPPTRIQPPSAGVPTALLEQMVPLPRLATAATTTDPADSLAALTDQPSQPARSEPADTAASVDADRSTPEADAASKAGEGPAAGEPGQPWRSSAASLGRSHVGGEGDPGLPRGDVNVIALPQTPRVWADADRRQAPPLYSLRTAPDRSRLAERHGATSATEQAVNAALKWLADNQEPDGRWDADRHGAGRELLVSGHNRQSAGIQADTGMTGLALLAFLASGHTHREGLYRENVRHGLQYLLSEQADDGNLGGRADTFAMMYCHAMAACALSEAYGMTGDERLRGPVRRAIGYTIAAQDPAGGGFRYRPGDPGDTSQCGWQLMALKSAELAGIPMRRETRNGLIRFLRGVSAGEHGGLASYRPNEPVTRPMTAEALVCWQFLGMPREHPAGNEAGDYLLGELPGEKQANLYYWYYATLGMYQLQGPYWERWNDALRTTLLEHQRTSGPLAGSWDPETVWGGYGGRVYSTALATLCLEVYYRFLPLYDNAAPRDASAK
jgi:hypothetical protein